MEISYLNQLKSIQKCKEMGLKVFSVDQNPNAIGLHISDIEFVSDMTLGDVFGRNAKI